MSDTAVFTLLSGPLLDPLQTSLPLVLQSSELGPVHQVRPHQCWAERKDSSSDLLTAFFLAQVRILCCKGKLLACVQLVLPDSCVLFLKAAFQPVILQPELVHGAPQVQDLELISVLLSLSSLPSFSTLLAFLVVVLVVVLLLLSSG